MACGFIDPNKICFICYAEIIVIKGYVTLQGVFKPIEYIALRKEKFKGEKLLPCEKK